MKYLGFLFSPRELESYSPQELQKIYKIRIGYKTEDELIDLESRLEKKATHDAEELKR